MKDNYGENVPTDLVLLPSIDFLNDAGIILVVNTIWYDVVVTDFNNPLLCCSAKAIRFLSEDNLDDYTEGGSIEEIMRVNDVLKRWSEEDGFYHA